MSTTPEIPDDTDTLPIPGLLPEEPKPRRREVKHEIFNDHFQNYKRHAIHKAQLVIADIPYNVGKTPMDQARNGMWMET